MSKNTINSGLAPYKIGNFTKKAIQNFEKNITTKHDFLEEVDTNLKDRK